MSSSFFNKYKSYKYKSIFVLLLLFAARGLNAQITHWEDPRLFSPRNGSFPVSDYRGGLCALAWQETAQGAEGAEIRVNLAVRQGAGEWIIRENIAAYPYSGTEPAILSLAVDNNGRILIAAASSASETDILISSNRGESFTKSSVEMGSESSVAPRIFVRSDGGYLLFVTRGTIHETAGETSRQASRNTLSLYYARSGNGIDWSSFTPFVTESGRNINLLPSHVSLNNRDYIVFQSRLESADMSFQLYFKSSGDNGRSWSSANLITNFRDPENPNNAYAEFDNQRAHLSVQQGDLFVVWERRFQSRAPQIYGARLTTAGSVYGAPERINTDSAYCNNPIAFELRGTRAVVWFDNSQGSNRVIMSTYGPYGWERGRDLSRGVGGEASFARPLMAGNNLTVFWQSANNRIYSLAPDTNLAQPNIITRNFVSGRRSSSDSAIVGWTAPRSGAIRGYAWAWSKDPLKDPPLEVMSANALSSLEHTVDEDGVWYFSLIAQDYDGEWSAPVRVSFIRDTTPPPAAKIIAPETDANGFLVSNSFSMRWNTPPASDIAGYSWNMEYVGPASLVEGTGETLNREAARLFSNFAQSPRTIMGQGTSADFINQDNGLWVFSVFAIDTLGNIGPPSRCFIKTNKYILYTNVTFADVRRNDDGYLQLRLLGRGFLDEGPARRVLLDRDGQPPYDREYYYEQGAYRIISDSEISNLFAGDLSEGSYRVLIDHPTRGLYVSAPLFSVDKTGTIKFGDYTQTWLGSWDVREKRKLVIDTTILVLAAVMIFCASGMFVSIRGMSGVIAESAAIRKELAALITGDIMPTEKKKRIALIKKRGGGLRIKMASFTIALVTLVVIMISVPLYIRMQRSQEATLLQGLYDRSKVLLEGIATAARPYLHGPDYLELNYLPIQSTVIPEARYLTITGYSEYNVIHFDYVLATNDPDINDKLNTVSFRPGRHRLSDEIAQKAAGLAKELNEKADAELGEINKTLAESNREFLELNALTIRTPEQNMKMEKIADDNQALLNHMNQYLMQLSQIGSEPAFSTTSLRENKAPSYIFYKPILERRSADTIYYRGMVRLEVTIDTIIKTIQEEQKAIIFVILPIALLAIALGAVGAWVLSTLIIRPIARLVSHVERIRDTEDKAKLAGMEIEITTKDEIAVLGNTINDMTHGLVKAAIAASDLSLGKEIQKKFIPLELDKYGNKKTSGFKDTKNVQFFGYYEGAKGVSGDYFDYQDLDGRYFAIIKCDVAGKGIPAALIMIQVATMFLGHFRRWKPTESGFHIEDLVYQINGFIENMGFKGRFAAFTLCLFDSQTGLARFCNAGDNVIHWYDASERKMKTVTFMETPASGVIPNALVQAKGGYPVQTITLDRGDILFLYTDGIEESKRRFRNADYEEIACREGETGAIHENHLAGQEDEELSPERVVDIINAAMNRKTYTLHKYHNPEGEQHDLQFDFTACEGKVEDAIMAMVAVEKIFRIYKTPKADEDSRVLVDKKVDEFLQKYFRQYRDYCYNKKEVPGNDEYMYYTFIKEDEQYDDLTILGVYRK